MAHRKEQYQNNTKLLGTILKRVRQYRHMTETDLAKAMNIALSTYSGWETGRSRPAFEHVMQFAIETRTDGVAIMCALLMQDTDFALRCADNMFASTILKGLDGINDRLGDGISLMESSAIMESVEAICNSIVKFKKQRENTAEHWLDKNGFGLRAKL